MARQLLFLNIFAKQPDIAWTLNSTGMKTA
jgi:hypothetical protein